VIRRGELLIGPAEDRMQLSVESPFRKILLLGAAITLALAYTAFAATQFAASVLGNRRSLNSLQWAARLDPGNAEYRYRVGRFFWLVEKDSDSAVPSYRAAVALNPHEARYWFDLAAAYDLMGYRGGERDAMEHAVEADPNTPDVAWQAANFYVIEGNDAKALREYRVVMANDPVMAPTAIPLCWRMLPDVDALLRDVMPPLANVDSAFLDYLVSKQEMAAANKVWAQLVALQQPVQRRDIYYYIRALLADKESDQAHLAWQQAANLADLQAYEPRPDNLIVNGDFGLTILNGGFDWLYQRSSEVSLAIDPTQSHVGHRSLLIDFDARWIEDSGIRQVVAVKPNTGYEFSGYFKSDNIEGAGSPRFAIQDLYDSTMYYASEDLRDVDYWKQVGGEFVTGPNTKMLVVRVQRFPAGPIKGKLWIDGLRLVQKSSSLSPQA